MTEVVSTSRAGHLRSEQQYRESLRDGRRVFYRGEQVADVTSHPVFAHAVEHAALDYRMAHDPLHADFPLVSLANT